MNWQIIIDSAPLLMQGVLTTLSIWFGTLCISLSIGCLLGILRCRRMRILYVSATLDGITFVMRGVPFYVQLLIVYYVLPELLGISTGPILAGVLSLGLCSAAYVSQMVRGGINAIPDAQWEAAFVLGLSTSQTVYYIILPQATRIILPMITNELDQLLKSTSIISAIGVLELTRMGQNIIAREMQVVPIYLIIAVLYLGMSSALNGVSNILERSIS